MTDSRYVDNNFSELQKANQSPIFGYEELPLLTLEEAVTKLSSSILRLFEYVKTAKEKCNKCSTLLTLDESAAIYLYTMPTIFYASLNEALRAEDRHALKPWFAFLKLFITALEKLPSVQVVVWRGIRIDDFTILDDTDPQIWWSVNSCSINVNVVEPYIGEKGVLFAIESVNTKNIAGFSSISDEQEFILMPGTRLRRRFEPFNFINKLLVIHFTEENDSSIKSNYLFEAIKQKYQQNNRIHRIMNPAKSFPIEDSYINLAIVHAKDQQTKEKQFYQAEEIDTIIGSYEEVYGATKPIEIRNMFKSCTTQEKQILVFGRAGIGKSTFCRFIAYQWAKGVYWSQYELLALVPLRCLTADRYPLLPSGQTYSLFDIVKKEVYPYELSGKEEKLFKEQFDSKKILWVLDGYDEIIENIPSHLKYLFEQLLRTPHHILVSRPYMNTLSYSVQMEIIGFTDDNILKYVEQFFDQMKNEIDDALSASEILIEYLNSKASVWGIAHVPVNLELICSVWSNEDREQLQVKELTVTSLYTTMVEWLFRRYLMLKDNRFAMASDDEIYENCNNELMFLESLAFNAMMSNTIIIRPDLLIKAFEEVNIVGQDRTRILNIGILKCFDKQGVGTQIETKKDYYFIHLSFQEYFAARYVVKALKRPVSDDIIEFIQYEKYNWRYILVFRFIAGLLGTENQMKCADIFWNLILNGPIDIIGIRPMQLIIACLDEDRNGLVLEKRQQLIKWIADCFRDSIVNKNQPESTSDYLAPALKNAPNLLCESTIVQMFVDLLENDDVSIQKRTLKFFLKWNSVHLPDLLINTIMSLVADENDDLRSYACQVLGYIGEKTLKSELINTLLGALQDESSKVISSACDALARIGKKVVTNEMIAKLFIALKHRQRIVQSCACLALADICGETTSDEIINKLLAALTDERWEFKATICNALMRIGEKIATSEVIDKLLAALLHEDPSVRGSISKSLLYISKKRATNEVINKLLIILEDTRCEVRMYACEALGIVGKNIVTKEMINKLLMTLDDKEAKVRAAACETLGRITQNENVTPDEIARKLVIALEDQQHTVRACACQALGIICEKTATSDVIDKLLTAIKDRRNEVRDRARKALAQIARGTAMDEVVNKLLIVLESETTTIKMSACFTIVYIGERAATDKVINKLLAVLEDQECDCDVRYSIYEIFGSFGAKAVNNEVIDKLMTAVTFEQYSTRECVFDEYSTRECAFEALMKIGEKTTTNKIAEKLCTLLDSEINLQFDFSLNLPQVILKSSVSLTEPICNKLLKLCSSPVALICLLKVSIERILNIYINTQNIDWLNIVINLALLNGVAIVATANKTFVYEGAKRIILPLSISILQRNIKNHSSNRTKTSHRDVRKYVSVLDDTRKFCSVL